MKDIDIDQRIKFSIVELKKWEKLQIKWITILSVITWKIFDEIKWEISTFESSVYYWWELIWKENSLISMIQVDNNDIILNIIDVETEFWQYCHKNWSFADKLFPWCWLENTDLYRSDYIDYIFNWVKYRLNFWYCWPYTNCRIHNKHSFIEVHTNVAWDWFMQKFELNNENSLIETVWLMPWSSHRRFDIIWNNYEDWNPKYPYHRWLWWNSWNIWLVIEKH